MSLSLTRTKVSSFPCWLAGIGLAFALGQTPPTRAQDADMIARIEAALPDHAPAKPRKPRHVLIFTLTKRFRHASIPTGAAALKRLGERTGAYTATISDDPNLFAPDRIAAFDAIILLSTTGELFDAPSLKRSLLDHIAAGHGLIGIHAATDCFYQWSDYGRLMGGYFNGHPWHENVTIRIDDPRHPVCAMFAGKSFQIVDEIYQFRAPYSRNGLRVLTRLDPAGTDMTKAGIKRTDGDFAVSWVSRYGLGRVFQCSLGHRAEVFANPLVLRHYLAGIQFALGDLDGDTTPSAMMTGDWVRLFNGHDLAGWTPTGAEPARPWRVANGILVGRAGGPALRTQRTFTDYTLQIDYRTGRGVGAGVRLPGGATVRLGDDERTGHAPSATAPDASSGSASGSGDPTPPAPVSGGLILADGRWIPPTIRANNPAGSWNTLRVRALDGRLTVILNDQTVVENIAIHGVGKPAGGVRAEPIALIPHPLDAADRTKAPARSAGTAEPGAPRKPATTRKTGNAARGAAATLDVMNVWIRPSSSLARPEPARP